MAGKLLYLQLVKFGRNQECEAAEEREMAKRILVSLVVTSSWLCLAAPAMAVYNEVYRWDGVDWILATNQQATMFSEGEDSQQFRFSSSGCPGSAVYLPPKAGNPCQFLITNVVHYFPNPWIEVWISETELIWDVFKPGSFMAEAFIIGVKSHAAVQILFGSGTIRVPDSFDPENSTVIWKDWTKPAIEEHMVEDIERRRSLLPNKNQEGTPPDTIDISYWWHVADEKPDLHIWDSPTEPIPAQSNVGLGPDQWKRASDMNGRVIVIEDIDVWKYLVFFENLKVESAASEGKYFEQFSISVAPTL